YRIRSAEYVGEKLLAAGIAIVEPPGGHAIYLDAAAFCPHIARDNFPGQALVVALYRHAGVRACEIGSVMFGPVSGTGSAVPDTGGNGPRHPRLELVRLAFPRRVYTQSHMDYVVEALTELHRERQSIRGLRIVQAPAVLRHFSA